ncbi:uncharacterized protein LOC121626403 isoform X2 [Chelmon rostratus]|uniref:uncharacterized protein LOC121626403 isoform X2 n=1 Tax=Chelmon rostratus TaxID=109905 RepID=UPI001BED3176|nr:uncharacterized protein LOC121626403 isoform X2 [Chelmon rostratus]
MPPSLLLLLLVCSTQASHFYGTVMTYYPKNTYAAGYMEVVLRYKLSFHSCTDSDSWTCLNSSCGAGSVVLHEVDKESSGEWCQREGIMTRQVPTNAAFQLVLDGGNWISGIKNGIVLWRAVTTVEVRNRSDTGRANRSPQTTVLPAVRVPSNCPRDFHLLAFDPDGDEVQCRYGNNSTEECNPCTPPSVLDLSSSCSLSFRPSNSSVEGPYAVQLVMEDFPRQTITLTHTNGEQTTISPNNSLSQLPVQFVLRVDPVVPSCTEGLYLPKFLPPTPASRSQLHAPVNQSLEISIRAQANISTISELLFSGPYNVNQMTSGTGQFVLRWTPSEDQDGESHPICFVVQAVYNSVKYHSELRCVVVTVGDEPSLNATTESPTTPPATTPGTPPPSNQIVIGLSARISSLSPLSADNLRTIVEQQLKDELVRRGLPSDIILRLVSHA